MSYVKTIEMSREEWLSLRQHGIGGSDAAAVLGLSSYKTPLDVYLEKIAPVAPDVPPTPRMKAGLKLEQTVADWYEEESGYKVQRDNKVRIHPDYNFLIANLDRVILPKNGEGRGVLEIKTTSSWYAKGWEATLPMEFYAQLQHYLNVTGYTWGEFAILIDGYDFQRFKVERDDNFIQTANEVMLNFWERNVLAHVPPPPKTEADLKGLYPESTEGEVLEAAGETYEAYQQLVALKSEIKTRDIAAEQLEFAIKLAMGPAESLEYNGDRLISWKVSKPSKVFDATTFKAVHKDLYESFQIEKPGSRRFLIK